MSDNTSAGSDITITSPSIGDYVISDGTIRFYGGGINSFNMSGGNATLANIRVDGGGSPGQLGQTGGQLLMSNVTVTNANTGTPGVIALSGGTYQIINSYYDAVNSVITSTPINGATNAPSNFICRANLGTTQTITANSDNTINHTAVTDPYGWLNGTTHIITPTIAGYYWISGSVTVEPQGAASGQINFQINTTNSGGNPIVQSPYPTTQPATLSNTFMAYFNGTTDNVKATVYLSGTNSDITAGNATFLQVSLIR